MFRFLRFELGGASALFWMLLFLAPHLNVSALLRIDSVKLFTLVFSSITLSIPLGNYIHQLTDTLFNPFRRRRLFFWPRETLKWLDAQLSSERRGYRDDTFQAILVFSKVHDRITKSGGKPEKQSQLRIDLLREEISNRYSYYYARFENGAVAPAFGFGLAILVAQTFGGTEYILPRPSFSIYWIVGAATFLGTAIVWRIPHLFRELDDIEVALLNLQRPIWPKV